MNEFLYSNSNKRYHTLDYYYKNKFHTKVFKISLNANFTCPNIDGTKGVGGCIYCSKTGSGEFAGNVKDSIETQFNKIKEMMHHKWREGKYIAYFQARTNTYAPVDRLKEIYEPVLKYDNVIGLNEFYYCYEKVKKYLKENGGSHQNLLSATYLIASNISSNVFFVDFANATTKDAEIRNLFLAAKCKCLEEIITDALNETCKSVDKSKVRELVRRD